MSCRDLYVGLKGRDDILCGTSPYIPCFTLTSILQKAQDHDVIHIDGHKTDGQPMNLCSENFLNKSLSFIGYGDIPHITCLQKYPIPILKFASPYAFNHHCMNGTTKSHLCAASYIILKNIHLKDGFVLAIDVQISITDSIFEGSSLIFGSVGFLQKEANIFNVSQHITCNVVKAILDAVSWLPYSGINLSENLDTRYDIYIFCEYIDISITNSQIHGQGMSIVPGELGGEIVLNTILFAGCNSNLVKEKIIIYDRNKSINDQINMFTLEISNSKLKHLAYCNIYNWNIHRISDHYAFLLINSLRHVKISLQNSTLHYIGYNIGVHIQDGTGKILSIENCNFTNSATHNGSVIYIEDGKNMTVGVKHCNFTHNKPPDKYVQHDEEHSGQVLHAIDVSVHVKSCIFLQNEGAILFLENSNVVLQDNIFSMNKMTSNNGVIFVQTSNLNVMNCTWRENQCEGDLIHIEDSNATMTDSIFIGNSAANSFGGALSVYNCNIILSECTFTSNTVRNIANFYAFCGGMYAYSSHVIIENSSFVKNVAKTDGGGICLSGCIATIRHSVFVANKAHRGGALYVHMSKRGEVHFNIHFSTFIHNCVFKGNVAYEGGAIYHYGYRYSLKRHESYNVSFSPLLAGIYYLDLGHTVYFFPVGKLKIFSSKFIKNTAGAINVEKCEQANIISCQFIKNEPYNHVSYQFSYDKDELKKEKLKLLGGAIYSEKCRLSINHSLFSYYVHNCISQLSL